MKKLFMAIILFGLFSLPTLTLSYLNNLLTEKKDGPILENCANHLGNAARANTIEEARLQLGKAINYLEEKNITYGLYKKPDMVVRNWYNELKSLQNDLEKVDSSTSKVEKEILILKLREKLKISVTVGCIGVIPCVNNPAYDMIGIPKSLLFSHSGFSYILFSITVIISIFFFFMFCLGIAIIID